MTLDLTKPMKLIDGSDVLTPIYHDEHGALVEGPYGKRVWHSIKWLQTCCENTPPEPVAAAVGPEEVWVSFRKESHIYGELWSAHKSREYAPSVATAVVRYLRADLAARKEAPAPQRVKPLTYKECADVPVRMDMWFREVMAARGIEVGE